MENVRTFKKIKLTQGKYALVDAEDFEYLNQWKWQYHKLGYATKGRHVSQKESYMHRLIMSAKPGQEVDHKNLKKLDNRRANLRVCSSGKNKANQPKSIRNKVGYKGVSKISRSKINPYRAAIVIKGKQIYLGVFPTAKLAHIAYKNAALKLHGEFARWE